MKYPADLKYAASDEWIRIDGDEAVVGISDFAQDALNDIVYIELKEVGEVIDAGEPFGEVESVKAASELVLPVSGEIIEINSGLEDDPEVINADPYGAGWMVKIKITDDSNLANLMDVEAYKAFNEDR
ncbi:MAG: glycine cleavage system protein GcvH [Anaerolineae bacterium]|nr:glycine cleavage system protein GcvH [Anaerolineae bacterium]MCA9894087.1 glycine cleavage system protein GcvH [Anaerolineae bacterium]MCB9459267.1 glycine cleavage system protein GcvH [Anaerolineaceae bacterium]